MLKTLYDHFVVLYKAILPDNPSLASEHALRQEEDVYKISTKLTYRNASLIILARSWTYFSLQAVIQCVAALKRRPVPISVSHPSVGTEAEVIARAEAHKSLESLHLSRKLLEPLVHSLDQLKTWGYFLDIPPGPGGDQPSLEESIVKCDRCAQYFLVKRIEAAEKCIYHWGKPYSTRVNGE
jgi:RNA exonuclease 1